MDNRNDFTYDKVNFKGLPQFVKDLHAKGMHYIPLIDPGVSAGEKPGSYPPFDKGMAMDIFVKNSSGQPFTGKVTPFSDLFNLFVTSHEIYNKIFMFTNS